MKGPHLTADLSKPNELISPISPISFSVILWKNQENGPIEFVSNKFTYLLGYQLEYFLSGEIGYLDLIHPEDLKRYQVSIDQAVNEKLDVLVPVSFRLKMKSGKWMLVHEESITRKDENGNITHFEAHVMDLQLYNNQELTQKKYSKQLKYSDEVFSNSGFEAIFVSENGYCMEQNLAAKKMLGYSDSEAIGMYATEIIAAESIPTVTANLKNGHEKPYDVVMVKKDGTNFHAEIQGRNISFGGRLKRITAIRDVSERKQAELEIVRQNIKLDESHKKLQSKSNYLLALNNFARKIEQVNSVDDIIWDIVETVIEIFHFEDCEIFLFDKERHTLIQSATHRLHQKKNRLVESPMVINLGEGIVGSVGLLKTPIFVPNTTQDDRYVFWQRSCLSELAVPMIVDGELIGVIDSEHPEMNFYTKEHITNITTIANIAGSRIKIALAEEKLMQSELKHRLIFEHAHEAILLIDNGIFLDCNSVAVKMFGCNSKTELLGYSALEFSPEFQYGGLRKSEELRQVYEDKAVSEPQNFEWLHIKKNGANFDAEVSLNSFSFNGKLLFQTIVRDVTKKKNDTKKITEQQNSINEANAILKSKTEFLEIVNSFAHAVQSVKSTNELVSELTNVLISKFHFTDCMVYLLDEKRDRLIQNQSSKEDEIITKVENPSSVLKIGEGIVGAAAKARKPIRIGDTSKDSRYIPDEVFRYSELAFPLVVNGKLLGVIDTEHSDKYHFTDDHENLVSTLAGIFATRLLMLDSEKALKESDQRHRLIFAQAKDAIILVKEGVFFDCNEMTVSMFGCENKSQIIGTDPLHWSPKLQYDGIDSAVLSKENIKIALSGNSITFPWIHKKQNGEYFDAEVSLSCFELNEEQYVQGMIRNVTERKALNKSLKESESLYRNLIETTETVAWELDLKTKKFTYIGALIESLTGYSVDHWQGYSLWIDSIHRDDQDEVIKEFDKCVNSGVNHIIEYRVIKADKSIAWVRDVTTIVMKNKVATKLQGYFIDITTEKESSFVKEEFTLKLKEKVDELYASRENFKHLFDDSLVAFMEQDVTLTFKLIQSLQSKGITNIVLYLNENPAFVDKCLKSIIILQVNKALKKLVKVPSVQDIENNLEKFFNEETMQLLISILEAMFNGNKELIKETTFVDYSGDLVHGLVKLYFKYDKENESLSSIISIVNITERVNAETELFAQNKKLVEVSNILSTKNVLLDSSRKRFKELFEHTPVSLWEEDLGDVLELVSNKNEEVADFSNYIESHPEFVSECISKIDVVNVNLCSLDLFGVKTKEELKQHLEVTFNDDSYRVLKQELISIAAGHRKFTSETEFLKANGDLIHAILTFEIIGVSSAAIVSIVDVTAIKKAEMELIGAKEKAEESDRLKTEFLNNISHEIRTPLNGIIGFSNFLSDKELTPSKRSQYVSTIQNSGQQLIRIIDEVLEISKLNNNGDRLKINEVCINNMLFDLFSIFSLIGDEKGVKLTMNYDVNNADSNVLTDETKLNKILNNILQNAFKFTQKGSVDCSYQFINGNIEFSISDTGIGIKDNKLTRIFERFAQEDLTTASSYGGLGLGLSIVKEHVELLGGQIFVKSKKNQGSTFTVTIPHNPVKTKTTTKKIKLELAPIINKKNVVLMVEDDAVNAMLMQRYLEKSNLFSKVIHAFNGQDAIDFCKENKDIDVVLMDIGIPIKNGYEATSEIKVFRPNLPIIAQTAYTTKEDRARILKAGCDDIIAKPIDYVELLTLVKTYLLKKVSS